MLPMLKENTNQLIDFLKQTTRYFRDVLLMHGLLLFMIIPLLSNGTKFLFQLADIPSFTLELFYPFIFQHPFITFSLIMILLSVVVLIYFEFTFLLLSLYFIKKEQPISLKQLLSLTFMQIKKLRPAVILFFLFYFFLVLPLGGFSLHSELLAKIKLPAFIIDFIFINRLFVIILYLMIYLLLSYIALRLTFTLPAMILLNASLRQAIRHSLHLTRKNFWKIISQLVFITIGITFLTSVSFSLVLGIQRLIELFFPSKALPFAVVSLLALQLIYVINLVLSTIIIFYLIIEWLDRENYLFPLPSMNALFKNPDTKRRMRLKWPYVTPFILMSMIILLHYNYTYLTNVSSQPIVTISHRGVSQANGVQNSIEALRATSQYYQPDFIEMDIQMTKDHQFVVFHDFNLRSLTGLNQIVEESTLSEILPLTVRENDQQAAIPSFDAYLEQAKMNQQKLLIEIKTQRKDEAVIVHQFLQQYKTRILEEGHLIQALSLGLVETIKNEAPELTVGYIIPFHFVGLPVSQADFFMMEYSTLNRSFIDAAHNEGKCVFTWTPNQTETMERMMFYGVEGIVTDRMDLLTAQKRLPETMSYADKLAYFLIGIG